MRCVQGRSLSLSQHGEIIDEAALIAALDAGKLHGVGLDVYIGEFELAQTHGSVMTSECSSPRISRGGTDILRHQVVKLFCENLQAYLAGRPLINVSIGNEDINLYTQGGASPKLLRGEFCSAHERLQFGPGDLQVHPTTKATVCRGDDVFSTD